MLRVMDGNVYTCFELSSYICQVYAQVLVHIKINFYATFGTFSFTSTSIFHQELLNLEVELTQSSR